MAAQSRGLSIAEADPERTYLPEEQERLTQNLRALLSEVHRGTFSDYRIDRSLLSRLHGALFAGVRNHAGRIRTRDFGSERLVFGPHRSSDRSTVVSDLEGLFTGVVPQLRKLESERDDLEFARGAFHLAAWLHAKVIKVHPFEDGNGRIGRTLMSVILVRLGFRALPMAVPREEYLRCLNHFYTTDDPQPLIDLCLRLYPA